MLVEVRDDFFGSRSCVAVGNSLLSHDILEGPLASYFDVEVVAAWCSSRPVQSWRRMPIVASNARWEIVVDSSAHLDETRECWMLLVWKETPRCQNQTNSHRISHEREVLADETVFGVSPWSSCDRS